MTKRRCLTKVRVSSNDSPLVENSDMNKDNDPSQAVNDIIIQQSSAETESFEQQNEESTENSEIIEKRRGPTILADIWNQSPNEKVVVKFNSYGQPIGDEAGLLASFIRTIGRNPELAPQGYSDWRLVPREYKDRCMTEIKLRFIFPPRGKHTIEKDIGKRVKDYRGELKDQYYEPNKNNRSLLLSSRPDRVPEDQWLKLISYWSLEKTKRRANTNKINQSKMKMPHCAGRKSFARHRNEKLVTTGVEPSRAQVFIDYHKDRKTRDKKKIDEASARVVESIKEKLAELPSGVEDCNGRIAWKGDIYDQVINKPERHGQVRGVGSGVCPSKLLSCQSRISQTVDDLQSPEFSNEHIEKIIEERLKVVHEDHKKELKFLKEKSDSQYARMKQRQTYIESNFQHVIMMLKKDDPSKFANYEFETDDEEFNDSM